VQENKIMQKQIKYFYGFLSNLESQKEVKD